MIDAEALRDPLASRVTLAVTLGLLVGKPLGITLLGMGCLARVLPRGA